MCFYFSFLIYATIFSYNGNAFRNYNPIFGLLELNNYFDVVCLSLTILYKVVFFEEFVCFNKVSYNAFVFNVNFSLSRLSFSVLCDL